MGNLQFTKLNEITIVSLTVLSIFVFLLLPVDLNNYIVYSQLKVNNNTVSTPFVKIKDLIVHVDLAITSDQQEKGLSIKNSLNDSQGMLFPFDKPGDYAFWMKDMKFPIDIIWISPGYKIVHIEKNLQPCIFFLFCPSYSPHADSKYVLEVNSNFTTRNNITVGDSVYINIPKTKNS
jgi:uncharacterized membrane protein (UPF0127 family)